MHIGVIGLGLIGGSFAKAAARHGHVVSVYNRTRATCEQAVKDGVAAAVLDETLVSDAGKPDLFFIALPPACVIEWIDAHHKFFKAGAVVVDATGVKVWVCDRLLKYAVGCDWTFVGGHPMAGKEFAGYANSSDTLYDGASMIFTPYPSTGRGTLDMLSELFVGLGFGKIVFTTPENHDKMIALTSQMAHVVSSAYVHDPLAKFHDGYSAGSYRDMTRVARLDPDTWTFLFEANRDALTERLDCLIARLGEYRDAIKNGDTGTLRQLLSEGRKLMEECD